MAQFITAAGIDVSKAWLDVALWPDDAALLHIERSEAGCFDRLAAWLREHGVGPEASGGYETEVMDALPARGFEVIRYNAYGIRMFAKANGRLATKIAPMPWSWPTRLACCRSNMPGRANLSSIRWSNC